MSQPKIEGEALAVADMLRWAGSRCEVCQQEAAEDEFRRGELCLVYHLDCSQPICGYVAHNSCLQQDSSQWCACGQGTARYGVPFLKMNVDQAWLAPPDHYEVRTEATAEQQPPAAQGQSQQGDLVAVSEPVRVDGDGAATRYRLEMHRSACQVCRKVPTDDEYTTGMLCVVLHEGRWPEKCGEVIHSSCLLAVGDTQCDCGYGEVITGYPLADLIRDRHASVAVALRDRQASGATLPALITVPVFDDGSLEALDVALGLADSSDDSADDGSEAADSSTYVTNPGSGEELPPLVGDPAGGSMEIGSEDEEDDEEGPEEKGKD